MPKRTYIPDFASDERIPYLGMWPGEVWCENIAELEPDVEAISFGKKVKGLRELSAFKKLRRASAPLTPVYLDILLSIPNLEYLQLTPPRSPDIPSLAGFTKLRSLVMRCNRHQTDAEFIRGMSWLHSLCLSEAVSMTSLGPLETLTELRELYIDGAMNGPRQYFDSFDPLSELKHLEYVILLTRQVKGNTSLRALHSLKKLKYLYLIDVWPKEEYDALLAALPKLREIKFAGSRTYPPAKKVESGK